MANKSVSIIATRNAIAELVCDYKDTILDGLEQQHYAAKSHDGDEKMAKEIWRMSMLLDCLVERIAALEKDALAKDMVRRPRCCDDKEMEVRSRPEDGSFYFECQECGDTSNPN